MRTRENPENRKKLQWKHSNWPISSTRSLKMQLCLWNITTQIQSWSSRGASSCKRAEGQSLCVDEWFCVCCCTSEPCPAEIKASLLGGSITTDIQGQPSLFPASPGAGRGSIIHKSNKGVCSPVKLFSYIWIVSCSKIIVLRYVPIYTMMMYAGKS